jgi:hypothetical protein
LIHFSPIKQLLKPIYSITHFQQAKFQPLNLKIPDSKSLNQAQINVISQSIHTGRREEGAFINTEHSPFQHLNTKKKQRTRGDTRTLGSLSKKKKKLYTAFDSSAQSFPPKQRPLSLNLSNSIHSPITLTVSLKTKTQTLHHCHQAPPSQFKPNPLRRRLALHQTSDCLFLVSATTVFAHHTAII